MPINVSEAIDFDTAEKVILERQTGGSRVDGRFVPTPAVEIKMLASVQQPDGSSLEKLVGANKKVEHKLFICNKKVYTVDDRDGIAADIIRRGSQRFKAVKAQDWNAYGHSTVIGALIP